LEFTTVRNGKERENAMEVRENISYGGNYSVSRNEMERELGGREKEREREREGVKKYSIV